MYLPNRPAIEDAFAASSLRPLLAEMERRYLAAPQLAIRNEQLEEAISDSMAILGLEPGSVCEDYVEAARELKTASTNNAELSKSLRELVDRQSASMAELRKLTAQAQAGLVEAQAERDALADALLKLRNEAGGLGAFDVEVIQAIGQTNWNVLQLRKAEAEAALRKAGRL